MWPLLQRELRAEARRPLNTWLRVAAAGFFFLLLEFSLHSLGDVSAVCRRLFPVLHSLLLLVAWVVGPLLTAEAIAKEKREGTLELLLLTPLSLDSVLRAKTFVLTLRTVVLVIGAFPVLSFTLLFGGVGRDEIGLLVLLQGASLTLALGVGVCAAAPARTWLRALSLALVLAVFTFSAFALGLFALFQRIIGDSFARELWPPPDGLREWIQGAIRLVGDVGGVWSETLGTIPRELVPAWQWLFGAALLVAQLVAVVLGVAARWGLRRSLSAAPAAPRKRGLSSWWQPGPVPTGVRRRWLRGNPLRWLMRYPGEVRLFRWLGAAAMALGQVVLWRAQLPMNVWYRVELALGLLFSLGLALAAAASFRRERDEGGLEMLMVTPVTARQITLGRVTGLWWQFGPVYFAWAAGLLLTSPADWAVEASVPLFFWITGLLAALPAIGLEAAFQFHGYWKSACATVASSVGVGGMLFWMGLIENSPMAFALLANGVVLVVALLCGPGFELRLQLRRNGENIGRRGRRHHPHRRRSTRPKLVARPLRPSRLH